MNTHDFFQAHEIVNHLQQSVNHAVEGLDVPATLQETNQARLKPFRSCRGIRNSM
jgi:hypothetical protein